MLFLKTSGNNELRLNVNALSVVPGCGVIVGECCVIDGAATEGDDSIVVLVSFTGDVVGEIMFEGVTLPVLKAVHAATPIK